MRNPVRWQIWFARSLRQAPASRAAHPCLWSPGDEKRVLITGASGFIGRVAVERLIEAGYSVRAATRDLRAFPSSIDIAAISVPIDAVDWKPILAGVDFVVHVAGLVHVAGQSAAADTFDSINRQTTKNLARDANEAGVARLVFISSVRAQTGSSANHPVRETDISQPTNDYTPQLGPAMPAIHKFELPPPLLKRGFWIYVWKIRTRRKFPKFYVGMTGDTGSYSAQSPINRISAHLGHNKRSNALQRYLKREGIEIESCDALEFAAFGPIGTVPTEKTQYRVARAEIAAIEKHLWQHMHAAGMDMLNQCPASKAQHNPKIFKLVRAAFTPFFERE